MSILGKLFPSLKTNSERAHRPGDQLLPSMLFISAKYSDLKDREKGQQSPAPSLLVTSFRLPVSPEPSELYNHKRRDSLTSKADT